MVLLLTNRHQKKNAKTMIPSIAVVLGEVLNNEKGNVARCSS